MFTFNNNRLFHTQLQDPEDNLKFTDYLQVVAQKVEGVLEKELPPPTTHLHEAMRYSVLGDGKRLRAFLVYESSKLFGVPVEEALKVGAAVEFIHAYSLVHDDLPCMDNANMRRGKPSCHKAFGEARAMLVGDALIPLAFQTLSSLKTPSEMRLSLVEKLSHVIGSHGLVAGQMMDLGQEKISRSYEGLCTLQRLKTGVLFSFASEAGAILGNRSSQEQEILRSYGLLFGQAFQMIDDLLDRCGDEATLGKPSGQDVEKFTFFDLLGPTLLTQKAKSIIAESIDILVPLGDRAKRLEEISLYSLSRIK